MQNNVLTLPKKRAHQRGPLAKRAVRTALALGCTTLVLVGCGGGSDTSSAETPTPLAAPENFTIDSLASFSWKAMPDATRYELFADLDGPGPQPEARMGEAEGFTYSSFNQQFSGRLASGRYRIADLINATYRLQACDANGCGAFTAAKAQDIPKNISYEFPSGYAPLKSSASNFDPISQDGRTLVLRGSNGSTGTLQVFTRIAVDQPWQLQAEFPTNAFRIALSADGNTLAGAEEGKVQIYQRSGTTWGLQTTITSTQTPAACPQPCELAPDRLALSANGNLLAVTGRFGAPTYATNAVFTYARNGATWAPQSHLAPGSSIVGTALALSGDGNTLALNSSAITRSAGFPPPYLHVYAHSGNGTWSEQARLPVGIVNFLDIAASRYSALTLSNDGATLAVEALNAPTQLPAEFHITGTDLACAGMGSAAPAWHMALFAREGAIWRRQAVIARDAASWALASDGNTLRYGGELFTRRNGTWACP